MKINTVKSSNLIEENEDVNMVIYGKMVIKSDVDFILQNGAAIVLKDGAEILLLNKTKLELKYI